MSKTLCALMACLTMSSVAMQPGITYLNPVQGSSGYHAGAVEPISGMQDPRTQGLNAQGLYGSSGGQAWAGSSAGAPTGLSAQLLPASVFFAQQAPLQSLPMAASPTRGLLATLAQPVALGSGQCVSPQHGQTFVVPANCDVPAMLYFPSVPTSEPIPAAPVGHDPQENLQERRFDGASTSRSNLGTFADTDYLEELAIAYHAQSQQPCGDELYCKILRDRAHALHLAVERPDVMLSTGMSKPFDPSMVKQFPEIAPLAYFGGNLAQYRLYQEVMHNLQGAVEQFYTHCFSDEATAITPLAINLLTSAAQQENPAAAFLLTDSSYHLLRFNALVHKMCDIGAQVIVGAATGTMNAAKGMVNFAAHVGALAKRLYQNPNQVVPMAQRGALNTAKACFEAAILLSCQDRDPSQGSGIRGPAPNDPLTTAHQHEFARRVQSFLDTCYGDPEQAAALIVEQLWYGAAAGKAVQGVCVGAGKAVGGAKALAQAVQTSQEVNWCLDDLRMAYLRWKHPARAAALASEVGPYEQFFTPLLKEDAGLAKAASNIVATQEAIKGGEQVVNKLVDQRVAIRPAESMINEGLEKVAARPVTLRERALALFQDKTPEVRMSHLKTVEKTARGTGYGGAHFECELPGFTIEDLGPIDALGSRARNIISNGKKKYSTTFPKLWGEEMVCNKIGEAWRNPIAGTEFDYGFVGKTLDGMRIHMWLGADDLAGAVFIKSAYPISEEKLLEIIKNIAVKKGK